MLWLGLSWLTLYLHTPLRPKHLPMLIPPLAVWGGIGIHFIFVFLFKTTWCRQSNLKQITTLVATILIVVLSIQDSN